ncbi:MAG: NADP-dependent malic enzyme [Planctomycetes bacterium]|nr:NADP-dependent malic enzyme [Planctomycetota bacterium]
MPSKEELLAKAKKPAEDAMRLHPFYKGKVQILPKCPVRDLRDFAVWYTPGVAAPCQAINKNPELVYEHTNKANSIAVISDGTRVLGLGDIGPEAGLPVMEGKALLFKYLGGVDAVPLCLRTKNPEEIIQTVKFLEPSFGGINLEDISQPKCFSVLDTLRKELAIPVWHDDQQGTATVLFAGLINALKVVNKDIRDIRIVFVGVGAANVSTYRLLKTVGIVPEQIIACDSKGILHKNRKDIEEKKDIFSDKWLMCSETNPGGITGGIREALRSADVCIAFSSPGPGIIQPEWLKKMNSNAIVFACANPIPEIWPWEAKEAGARIVATGRSDFPNQVNNSLGFPGIFRGVLDVRARTISDEMAIAAALALAKFADDRGINEDTILPKMDEWEVFLHVSVATATKAQEQGIARLSKTGEELYQEAFNIIKNARESTRLLMDNGLIRTAPENTLK